MTIEVRLFPDDEPVEMSREQLEQLIREEKVGEQALLRDRWTHPNWKQVFSVPRFRRAVTPDSALGKRWAEREAESRRNAREHARKSWPVRFAHPIDEMLGAEPWESVGWDCLAASRLSLFAPFFGDYWIITLRWSKDGVTAKFRSQQQSAELLIEKDQVPETLANVDALPHYICSLGPIRLSGLDGRTFVHRFACPDTSVATSWWQPGEQKSPRHWRLLQAYSECARRAGFEASGLPPAG